MAVVSRTGEDFHPDRGAFAISPSRSSSTLAQMGYQCREGTPARPRCRRGSTDAACPHVVRITLPPRPTQPARRVNVEGSAANVRRAKFTAARLDDRWYRSITARHAPSHQRDTALTRYPDTTVPPRQRRGGSMECAQSAGYRIHVSTRSVIDTLLNVKHLSGSRQREFASSP
jgi:hypothetical protein